MLDVDKKVSTDADIMETLVKIVLSQEFELIEINRRLSAIENGNQKNLLDPHEQAFSEASMEDSLSSCRSKDLGEF